MKRHPLRYVRSAALAAFVCALVPWPATAETPQIPIVPHVTEGGDPEAVAPDREMLLETLYQRLEQAETPDRAKAVAQNIERVWRSSGSASIDLLLARSLALISAEEYQLAQVILDTVVIAAPDFAEGWSQRAMVHFQKREFRAALDDLRRALAIEPKHFRAMQGVAVILNEFGEKERALQAYRRVLDVYPLKKEAREAVEELKRDVEGQDI